MFSASLRESGPIAWLYAGVLAVLLSIAASTAPAAAQELEPVTLVTDGGDRVFQVEIARTEPARATGLMYRRYLPADRGMLFEFDAEAPVSFWMKNTYISLDMVFISARGIVVGIARNAEPLSERVIYSRSPCIAVLEINAGVAADIGLKVGDKVKASFFKS